MWNAIKHPPIITPCYVMFKFLILFLQSLNIVFHINSSSLHPLLPEWHPLCSTGNKLCSSKCDEILFTVIPVNVLHISDKKVVGQQQQFKHNNKPTLNNAYQVHKHRYFQRPIKWRYNIQALQQIQRGIEEIHQRYYLSVNYWPLVPGSKKKLKLLLEMEETG